MVFDNAAVCTTCSQRHSSLTLCKHDILVKIIGMCKRDIHTLATANRQAVDIARSMQKLIRDFEPQMSAAMDAGQKMADFLVQEIKLGHFIPGEQTEIDAKAALAAWAAFMGPRPAGQ